MLKNEILDSKLTKPCCKAAFLSGVIKSSGSLLIENHSFSLIIQNNSQPLIEKCADIIEYFTKHTPEVLKKDKDRTLGSRIVFQLKIDSEFSNELLKKCFITDGGFELTQGINNNILNSDCCKKQFLRGVFCGSGIIGDLLSSDRTFLEISLFDVVAAENIANMLSKYQIKLSLRQKNKQYVLYTKAMSAIVDFCAFINANNTYFKIADTVLKRGMINDTNRAINCELANINKQLDAADKQIAAIKLIDDAIGIENLNEPLKESAKIRLLYPEVPISELITHLSTPVSKSGFNHRLRKLIEIANSIKNNKTEKGYD